MANLTKLFFGVCAVGLLLLFIVFVQRDGLLFEANKSFFTSNDPRPFDGRQGFQVDTVGCQIPEFDPFDPSVRILYTSPGKLKCPGPPPLVTANRTHVKLNLARYQKYHGIGGSRCNYRRIWRKDDGKSDNKFQMDAKGRPLKTITRIEDDFIYVECADKAKRVTYREFLPFIQVKREIETRCNRNFQAWVRETKDTIRERLNVIMVGIDSVSRLNMLRHLPRTYNFLRNVIGAIDLHGFNKVADNTFLNVVPLLTGLYVEECWNETLKSRSLNYLNLIWKDFSKKGYRTLFGEDAPDIATFNYMKAGFFSQPTDYYLRPFTLATERSVMRKYGRMNCFNARSEPAVVLNWLSEYLETFQDKPMFAYLFNSRLTHDYLNYAGFADEPYYNFMKRFHDSGAMNNSVLIFFSDHGIRFGKIRDTYVGKLEERMPFFMLAFPPWFSTKYPRLWKNLQINEHRLTTPFDIYQTLQEIINFTGEEKPANISHRGISIFSEINSARNCEDAAILPHWCTCHVRRSVSVRDIRVNQAARHMITVINDRLLAEARKCVELQLEKIVDARVSAIRDELLRFKDSHKEVIGRKVTYGSRVDGILDYLLTILVSPSGGLFEGTVRYAESTGIYHVMGDISRINKYGNQSICITNANLRKFCYCEES